MMFEGRTSARLSASAVYRNRLFDHGRDLEAPNVTCWLDGQVCRSSEKLSSMDCDMRFAVVSITKICLEQANRIEIGTMANA